MKRIAYITVLALMFLSIAAKAQDKGQERRMAVVNLSAIYMRQLPDYESALETQELMGTVVEIVGSKGYWREIISPQPYRAWTTEMGLIEMNAEQLQEYEDAPKFMFTGLYGHVFSAPSARSEIICDLVGGDILRSAKVGGRNTSQAGRMEARLSNRNTSQAGRMEARLNGRWTKVMLPSGKEGYVPTRNLKVHGGFIRIAQTAAGQGSIHELSSEISENVIAEAMKYLGSPYMWGGMSSKGTDCSGLVRICHLMNGVLLPRNASQQFNCGRQIPMEIDIRYWEDRFRTTEDGLHPDAFRKEMLRRISGLERGDLIFFGSPSTETAGRPRVTHVGIYLGDGRMIHSSQMVRINSLIPGEPDYYENSHRLVGAVRL